MRKSKLSLFVLIVVFQLLITVNYVGATVIGNFYWYGNSSTYNGNGGGPYSWDASPQYPGNVYQPGDSGAKVQDGLSGYSIESAKWVGNVYYNSSKSRYQRKVEVVYKNLNEVTTPVTPKETSHTWGSWVVTKVATCTETGTETRTCINDGATESRTIAALGHTWGGWSSYNDQLHKRQCSRCGLTDFANHNFGSNGNCTDCSFNNDSTAPTGSILINNGESTTNDLSVILVINANDNTKVDKMMVSNYSNFTDGCWENYSTLKLWTLLSGEGNKTVYIKFKDLKGNISTSYTDSIYFASAISQMPTASPASGTYTNVQYVSLYTVDGSTIRYTIDGTEPTQYSTVYSSPIQVVNNMTIKAKAYRNGVASQTMYETYVVNNASTVQTPTIVQGSEINNIQTAVIYGESGATLRYTINGTEPTEYSIVYSSPIQVTNNMTIKAKAYKYGAASATASLVFIIKDGDDLNALLTTAKSQYAAGRYDDSIATLNTLLSKDPDNEDAIQVLADNYIKKNDLITAKSRLVQFMAIYEYPRVINKYAQVCIKKGEYAEARDRILNILQKYSKETYLYQTLTDALEKLNETGIKVYVYGKEVDFTKYDYIYPEIKNGRTLIPIRALSETLGAQVDWDERLEKATIRLDGKTIEVTNGLINAKVNGINKTLDVAPYINNNNRGTRLMVPLRFISENFDRQVNWFSVESLVSIISITRVD